MLAKVTETISIEDLKYKWDKVSRFSSRPDPERFPIYPKDFVFDEDKSVKWNREERDRANEAVRIEKERLRKVHSDLEEEATDISLKYIMQEAHMNEKQASLLWSYVFEEYHSYMNDVFSNLDELIELHNEIVNAATTEEK